MAKPSLWSDKRAAAYRQAGYWTAATFVGCLDEQAARWPSAVAYSDPQRQFTWSAAKSWVDALACSLVRLGLERDAVVATWLPNCIENYLVRLACEKAGLIWLQVPISVGSRELRPILDTARAALLVYGRSDRRDRFAELQDVLSSLPRQTQLIRLEGGTADDTLTLDALAGDRPSSREVAALRERSVRPDETAMLQPTSGSTGVPKLCEYVLAGAMARGRAQAELFNLTPSDRFLTTVQGFGPSIPPLLAAPLAGTEVVVVDHLAAEDLLRVIEEHRPTIVCAVPPIYRELLPVLAQGRRRADSVRIWYSTGMALPADLAQRLEESTGRPVVSGYGGVDLGCWTAPAPEDPPEVRWFTIGRPRGGTELRLVGDEDGTWPAHAGEVWGRGPSSTGGYFGNPEATAEAWTHDGWFRTGDLGHFDADGNLVIVGRRVEVINRGGQKIYPSEIEQLLEEHPGVRRAALVPYADERLGQRACACVEPANGLAVTLEQVTGFLRGRGVASYKLPEQLRVVEGMPLTSGGKIDRRALQTTLDAQGALGSTPAASERR